MMGTLVVKGLKPAIEKGLKHYPEHYEKKSALGKFFFSKTASSMVITCNFSVNKVFTVLALSFSLMDMTGFRFCSIIYQK